MNVTAFKEAQEAYSRGDYARALQGFTVCTQELGDLSAADLSKFYHLIGNCYIKNGEPANAAKYYQKALDNSKHAIADGGIIILVGSCKEGLGEKTFEDWLTRAEKPEDLIRWVREDFKLGGHKAAAIAMVMARAKIYLVSDMEPDFVRTLFMEPYATIQEAFDDALKEKGPEASVIVMPCGGSTLPRVAADA